MNAVVTGCAGFIGSHLAERILEDGGGVLGVDNFLTGSHCNVTILKRHHSFTFYEGDISAAGDLHKHLASFRGCIDVVFHLASPASPTDYGRYRLEAMSANSYGTERSLTLAEKHCARFVLASTSEVYGEPQEHPQRESYWGNVNPVGPRACYDEAKRFAETLTSTYARLGRVDARIARIFNTYGPRMRTDDGRVIPAFITRALNDEPLVMEGDGSQTRSFAYVDDVVDGLLRLGSYAGQDLVFNLGNPYEISISELVHRLGGLVGRKLNIVHAALPIECPTRRMPDITRARSQLGWLPGVDLDDGLSRTIAFFEQERKRGESLGCVATRCKL